MRTGILAVNSAIVIAIGSIAIASTACSQVPKPNTVGATGGQAVVATVAEEPKTEASQSALSPEDQNATPFPAGRHAAVVKRVCTECHNANPILDLKFSKEEAERYYRTMVSSNIETDDAKKIIEYLSTTLGR
jgi:hypothetical protein